MGFYRVSRVFVCFIWVSRVSRVLYMFVCVSMVLVALGFRFLYLPWLWLFRLLRRLVARLNLERYPPIVCREIR